MTPEEAATVRETRTRLAVELARRKAARSSLIDFSTYIKPDYQVNFHHRIIASEIERWFRKETPNLAIFTPPQHGKSQLVSRHLPAWIFGQNPDAAVIATSYGASLASSMNRDVQRIIDDPAYQCLFPDVRLWSANVRTIANGSRLRNSDEFEIVNHNGYYRCAGVGGAITGRGFDYGIIDDPIKDRADSMSAVSRQRLKDWYTSVFRSRKRNESAGILLTMTRWHQDDLAGFVIEMMKHSEFSDQWRIVSLPAIMEDPASAHPDDHREIGESLWESRFGRKFWAQTRATVDPFTWSSVYKQDPSPSQGAVFVSDAIRYYSIVRTNSGLDFCPDRRAGSVEVPAAVPAEDCLWFQTIDTAQTANSQSDFTVIATWAWSRTGLLFLYDIFRARIEVPYQLPALQKLRLGRAADLAHLNPTDWLRLPALPWPKRLSFQAVEDKSSGLGLIQAGAASGKPYKVLKADQNKVQRAVNSATMWASGQVCVPRARPWLPTFIDEITKFPSSSHDDQVDCLSYAGYLCQHDIILTSYTESPAAYVGSDSDDQKALVVQTSSGPLEIDFGD